MLPLQAFPALLDIGLLGSALGDEVAGQNQGAKTLKLVMQSIYSKLVRNMEHCAQTRVYTHVWVFAEGADPSHG